MKIWHLMGCGLKDGRLKSFFFFNLVANIFLNKIFYLIGGFVSNYHIEMEAEVDGKIFTPIAGHQPPQVENLNCF